MDRPFLKHKRYFHGTKEEIKHLRVLNWTCKLCILQCEHTKLWKFEYCIRNCLVKWIMETHKTDGIWQTTTLSHLVPPLPTPQPPLSPPLLMLLRWPNSYKCMNYSQLKWIVVIITSITPNCWRLITYCLTSDRIVIFGEVCFFYLRIISGTKCERGGISLM